MLFIALRKSLDRGKTEKCELGQLVDSNQRIQASARSWSLCVQQRGKARAVTRASEQTGWRFGFVITRRLLFCSGELSIRQPYFRDQRSPNFMVAANCNGPSYRLTFEDAVNVWLRHWAGEYQNRIAASFDVNSARVNEVLKGHRHTGSEDRAREIAARDAA